jgi:hypothetical protein
VRAGAAGAKASCGPPPAGPLGLALSSPLRDPDAVPRLGALLPEHHVRLRGHEPLRIALNRVSDNISRVCEV